MTGIRGKWGADVLVYSLKSFIEQEGVSADEMEIAADCIDELAKEECAAGAPKPPRGERVEGCRWCATMDGGPCADHAPRWEPNANDAAAEVYAAAAEYLRQEVREARFGEMLNFLRNADDPDKLKGGEVVFGTMPDKYPRQDVKKAILRVALEKGWEEHFDAGEASSPGS